MKFLIHRSIYTIFVVLCSLSNISFGTRLNTDIQKAILESHLGASYGIFIENAHNHVPLYQQNASKQFIPASNTKLLTAIAALKLLGKQFRYRTFVTINSQQLHGHTLRGNLVFYFTGDPTLTTNDINKLVKRVKKAGIKRILGNVLIDQSAYTGPDIPIGWSKNDLNYCYGAKASSVILDQNCMHVNLVQTNTQKTKLIKFPDSTAFYIENNVKMVPKHRLKQCVFWPEITKHNRVYLKGCLPPKKRYSFSLAINNPALFAKSTIASSLKKYHILLERHIITAPHNHGQHIIAEHFSTPLSYIIEMMLQHSINLYANTLTRTLGRYYYRVGSFKAGVNAIKSILLTKAKVNFSRASLEDGSGLSRYNLISPKQFVQLINYALSEPALAKSLAKDLPLSGRSGTLYYRMNSKEMAGKVYAKTGSMHGVSSLSGYLYTKHHKRIVFSMIMNNFVAPLNKARALQDKILRLVYRLG